MSILIVDNGGYTLKAGFVSDTEPKVISNCVTKAKAVKTRVFVGNQLETYCKDLSGLYFQPAFQKGYLLNWDIQRRVWDYMLSTDCFNIPDCSDTSLLITEPPFNFHSIQEGMIETLIEDFGFNAICRKMPSDLSFYKHSYFSHTKLFSPTRRKSTRTVQSPKTYDHSASSSSKAQKRKLRQDNLFDVGAVAESSGGLYGKLDCGVVVDCGHSFTHIIPYIHGNPIRQAIKRIDIGGKVLTNHLKEIISYRQLMVMDETYVMNQVKEDLCYVTLDLVKDMEISREKGQENSIFRHYVLPDFSHIRRGYILPSETDDNKDKPERLGSEQLLKMNNERFAVPELLFHPSDVGFQQMGIPEAIIESINVLDIAIQPHLFSNIILTGGSSLFPGMRERVLYDVRKSIPCEYLAGVSLVNNPITDAWEGGRLFAETLSQQNIYQTNTSWLTRAEYLERGLSQCIDKYFV